MIPSEVLCTVTAGCRLSPPLHS